MKIVMKLCSEKKSTIATNLHMKQKRSARRKGVVRLSLGLVLLSGLFLSVQTNLRRLHLHEATVTVTVAGQQKQRREATIASEATLLYERFTAADSNVRARARARARAGGVASVDAAAAATVPATVPAPAPAVVEGRAEAIKPKQKSLPTTHISNSTTQCLPFATQSNSTTNYQQSTTLPLWMKDYFDWHRQQISEIDDCNFEKHRYLILRCSEREQTCGGVADRLKSLPFFVAGAAHSRPKRIVLIRWQRPTRLEEFLLPNEVHWSVPEWMDAKLGHDANDANDANANRKRPLYGNSGRQIVDDLRNHPDTLVIEGKLQDFYGGSSFYYQMATEMEMEVKMKMKSHLKQEQQQQQQQQSVDKDVKNDEQAKNDYAGWKDYERIFRDLFFAFFVPAPPVQQIVRDTMKESNLVPGNFSTTQYRAFYGIEHDKTKRDSSELTQKAENALNCASRKQPGDPIFFASDSGVAVQFAKNLANATGRPIVTLDNNEEREALHLDKKDQWTSGRVSDFYPTFVDLLVMAKARCMSHGVGGFGRFANLLSIDPSCVIRHDHNRKMRPCRWLDG